MNLESAILPIIYLLGALTTATVGLCVIVLSQGRRMARMEAVLNELAGKPRPRSAGGDPLKALLVLLLLSTVATASSASKATAAAWEDVKTVPVSDRTYIRYLSVFHVRDPKLLDEWKRVTDGWLNSLSRNRRLFLTHSVSADLFRVDLRSYKIPARVWEKFADVDPYFHQDVEVVKAVEEPKYETKMVLWEGGVWPGDGKEYAKGSFKYEKRVLVPPKEEVRELAGQLGKWLDPLSSKGLVKETNSRAPILRADWFLVQTSQQDERDGTGYFDVLEIKGRDDVDELVSLDRKLVEKKQLELRAIIPISNIALNNRQVARVQSLNGG